MIGKLMLEGLGLGALLVLVCVYAVNGAAASDRASGSCCVFCPS